MTFACTNCKIIIKVAGYYDKEGLSASGKAVPTIVLCHMCLKPIVLIEANRSGGCSYTPLESVMVQA